MFQRLIKLLDKIYPAEIVYAHCDVPCGIYETGSMLTAAETMGKMVEKMLALEYPGDDAEKEAWISYKNALVRMILEKEEQGEICKKELLILWTDYFKSEHLEKFPNLHEIFWKAAKLVSKNKQNVDMQAIQELKKAVAEIDAMFQKTKNK